MTAWHKPVKRSRRKRNRRMPWHRRILRATPSTRKALYAAGASAGALAVYHGWTSEETMAVWGTVAAALLNLYAIINVDAIAAEHDHTGEPIAGPATEDAGIATEGDPVDVLPRARWGRQ